MATPNPRKRKAPEELSTNPHTIKARTRNEKLSGHDLEIEKHKKADQAAITYAFSKLKESNEWKNATKEQQTQMKQKSHDEVTHKRKVNGKHWTVFAQSLGINGLYAVDDDGNPAWEDIEEESDDDMAEAEARWRANDIENGEQIPEISELPQGITIANARAMKLKAIGFKTWQRFWKRALYSMREKSRLLNLRGMDFLVDLSPVIDPKTSTFYDLIPPHVYFTPQEIAIWRNMATWDPLFEGELPGPAEWWPAYYNYTKYGFEVSATDNGQEEAFAMLFVDEEPDRYSLIFPSHSDLRVVSDPAEVVWDRDYELLD